jgi:hypothetical protein
LVASTSPEPLHQATELLNGALLEAEDALCDLELGVSASVSLDEERVLHFRKRGNEWALVVTRPGDDASGTELLKTSRKTRLDAAHKLPALHAALLDSYDVEHHRVEDAIQAVQAFTASLQGLRR